MAADSLRWKEPLTAEIQSWEIVRVWNSSSSFGDIIQNIRNFPQLKRFVLLWDDLFAKYLRPQTYTNALTEVYCHSAILRGRFSGGLIMPYDVNRKHGIWVYISMGTTVPHADSTLTPLRKTQSRSANNFLASDVFILCIKMSRWLSMSDTTAICTITRLQAWNGTN